MTLLKLLTFKAPKKEVDNQSKIGSQVMENNLKWLNKIADASVPKIEKSLKSSTKKASKRPSNSSTKPNQDRRKVQKREGDHSPSGTPSSVGPATLKLTNRRSIEASNKTFSDHDEAKENSVPEPPKDRRKILKKVGQSNPGTPVSDSPATSSKSSSSKSTAPCRKEAFSDNDEAKKIPKPPLNRQKVKKRGGQSTLGTPGSTTPAASPRTNSSKHTTRRSKETFSDDEETKVTPEPLQDQRKVKKRGGDETPGIPGSTGSSKINRSAKRSKKEFSDHDETEEKNLVPNANKLINNGA